ncbi:MAG: L-histidine N(alpha)-methyltransferase [Aquisalimonadaceae bacterium]
MTPTSAANPLHDQQPSRDTFMTDVLQGLRRERRQLSPKYFYDEAGSRLFDRICETPEYYVTRTELLIMAEHASDMGRALGPNVLLVEPGSGSSVKIRLLLDNLHNPAGYVPVEISRDHMLASVEQLQTDYPNLDIYPVCADFTRPFEIPVTRRPIARRAVYFPGSTIGNFPPADAETLLRGIHQTVGPNGAMLLGVDLRKDPGILLPAYDDAEGVTAAFNRNLLVRINRELGGDFDPAQFKHRAVWNNIQSRIEMHLVSCRVQYARVAGEVFRFRAGEAIVTEFSYKYTPERLARLAATAGFEVKHSWTDNRQWFAVYYLVRN